LPLVYLSKKGIIFRKLANFSHLFDLIKSFVFCRYKRFEKTSDSEIGSGSYGVVYKCMDRFDNDRLVAMKRIKLEVEEDQGIPPCALREITLLRLLNHPNVVKLG
jgi:hypothetical protein